MKTTVISYSFTGNNQAVAAAFASEIAAEHIQVTETKNRNMGTIVMDTLLNRKPDVALPEFDISDDDLVIFISPIWLGQIAAPMRAVFQKMKTNNFNYAFISLSGGADGPGSNDGIPAELLKRIGREPLFILDLHKADLLPAEPKPTRDMTMNYHITQQDVASIVKTISMSLKAFPALDILVA